MIRAGYANIKNMSKEEEKVKFLDELLTKMEVLLL